MKFYGSLLLCTCLVVFGCTKPEIDEVMLATQFQNAQQAINDAAELEAESLVPEEYGRAVKLMNFARDSQEKGDIPQSAGICVSGRVSRTDCQRKSAAAQCSAEVSSTIQEQIYQQIHKGT